jgi:hypothetical protein
MLCSLMRRTPDAGSGARNSGCAQVNSALSEKLRKATSSVELAVRYNSALGRSAELFGIDRRVGSSFYLRIFESELAEPGPKDFFSWVRSASKVGLDRLVRHSRKIAFCLQTRLVGHSG